MNHSGIVSNNPHLKFPGWNLGWKKPGDEHDPIMDSLIRHQVLEDADGNFFDWVGKYHYAQQNDPNFPDVTLHQFMEEKVGLGAVQEAQIEHTIRHTDPEDVWSEWMGDPYTEIGEDGRIQWASYVPVLGLFSGYRDFSVLEDAGFIVIIEASNYFTDAQLKITIESPIGKDILPRQKDMPSDETWLYRMFDKAGVLLYIGISQDAFIRFSQHAKDKPWIDDVARWERQKFNTRSAALVAEKRAIKTESPLFNVVHNVELK